MTRIIYVQKKAANLMLGDMFAGWNTLAVEWGHESPKWPAKRVVDYLLPNKSRKGRLQISLDDGSVLQLHPEMIVLVEERA